jgi:hypothetical protein
MFTRRIVARLRRNDRPIRPERRFVPRLAWACGLVLCIGVAFAIGHWSGQRGTKVLAESDSLASLKLIHETLTLFPNRVRHRAGRTRHSLGFIRSGNGTGHDTDLRPHLRWEALFFAGDLQRAGNPNCGTELRCSRSRTAELFWKKTNSPSRARSKVMREII